VLNEQCQVIEFERLMLSGGVLGGDTYTTFEEILCVAEKKNVDLILLGGDLFHDSKPTPRCSHDCMSLMRKYCMGDR
jgi:double-strand break repair protein MRE11